MRRASAEIPIEMEPVLSSDLVTQRGQPVTRVVRYRDSWLYASGHEDEESELVMLHFVHLLDEDPTLAEVALRRGQYAIQGRSMEGRLGEWERH